MQVYARFTVVVIFNAQPWNINTKIFMILIIYKKTWYHICILWYIAMAFILKIQATGILFINWSKTHNTFWYHNYIIPICISNFYTVYSPFNNWPSHLRSILLSYHIIVYTNCVLYCVQCYCLKFYDALQSGLFEKWNICRHKGCTIWREHIKLFSVHVYNIIAFIHIHAPHALMHINVCNAHVLDLWRWVYILNEWDVRNVVQQHSPLM